MKKELSITITRRVRFSEIDSMRRVWHGRYVTYFEDGREAFGRQFSGIGYADMQREGIYAPIYDIHVRCLAPLSLDDEFSIKTTYVYHLGARLDFKYEIRRLSDSTLCCEGSTTQLFIDPTGQLMTERPDFFQHWQQEHLELDATDI